MPTPPAETLTITAKPTDRLGAATLNALVDGTDRSVEEIAASMQLAAQNRQAHEQKESDKSKPA